MLKNILSLALCFLALNAHAMEQSKELNIFEACKVGDVARVQELIRSGISLNNRHSHSACFFNSTPFTFECTPMMIAASRGYLLIVAELIKAGADIHERCNYGKHLSFDAFCFAVTYKHFDVAEALLQAGANINRSARQSTYNHFLAKFFDRPVGQLSLLAYLVHDHVPQPHLQEISFLVASGARLEYVFELIASCNAKSCLSSVICNSFSVPSHSNAQFSAQKIKTLLLCLNRMKLPRDVRQLMLLEATPKELISVLAKRISQKKPMPIFALDLMTNGCLQATAEFLIPRLETAHDVLPGFLAQKNAGEPDYQRADAALEPFLDPVNFEANYGEELRANIRARLANPYWYKRKVLALEDNSKAQK